MVSVRPVPYRDFQPHSSTISGSDVSRTDRTNGVGHCFKARIPQARQLIGGQKSVGRANGRDCGGIAPERVSQSIVSEALDTRESCPTILAGSLLWWRLACELPWPCRHFAILRQAPRLCPRSLSVRACLLHASYGLLSMWPLLKRIAEANSCLAHKRSTSHSTIVPSTLASLPDPDLSTTSDGQSALQPKFEPKCRVLPHAIVGQFRKNAANQDPCHLGRMRFAQDVEIDRKPTPLLLSQSLDSACAAPFLPASRMSQMPYERSESASEAKSGK